MPRLVLCLLAVALITGCAAPRTQRPEATTAAAALEARKQRVIALQTVVETRNRLLRLAYPLLVNGVELCADRVRHTSGLSLWNSAGLAPEWRPAASEAFGLDQRIRVAFVAQNSPAARAGVRVGDVVESIGSWPIPTAADANDQVAMKLRDTLRAGTPFLFRVRRGADPADLTVVPERACAFALDLEVSDAKNAYADGERIVLTTGMMEFAHEDEEAALVIAHELAHNAMGHVDAKQTNALAGGLAGLLVDVAAAAAGVNTQGAFSDLGARAGSQAYSVEFEQEADYVAVYLLARAGYAFEPAPNFWRRMAALDPQGIGLRSTHPTNPERFVALERTVTEVKGKQQRGAPLMPELMPDPEGGFTVSPPTEDVDGR